MYKKKISNNLMPGPLMAKCKGEFNFKNVAPNVSKYEKIRR